jgi:pyruvate carboxylase subunit B
MTRIKITDTTFRDAHQSLMATRLRMEDMVPIAEKLDSVGFHSMEVWGGATFDAATRFLAEDPWERLRTFKSLMPNTPLQMLLRGQSLVGYRNYADDLVDAFVEHSADAGIDVFRVFDALNDERNLARSAEAVKRAGKHLQMTICYSVTGEGGLSGPIYNLDYFLERARVFRDMDADSICVKDMAGILAPYDSYTLIGALKDALDVPVHLHTHYTSGMASMTCLKAIEAGVDVVDACLAPLALRTSQPAVEPMIMSLAGGERDAGLDLEVLLEAGDYLEEVLPKYREHMETPRAAVIDARVLSHQIPGGMVSNLTSQLRQMDALDRLTEVLEEIPRTRKELGYPPLVTPMSQMVGTQAVSNVLAGRYELVSDEIKDYVSGLYGRAPAPVEPEVAERVIGDGEAVTTTGRPADLLEPEMSKAREDIKDISTDLDDVLTYGLYPNTGMKFLRIKHGLDPMPEEMKAKSEETPDPAPRVDMPDGPPPPLSENARTFNVHVGGQYFRVEVDPADDDGASSAQRDGAAVVPVGPEEAPDVQVAAPMPGLVSSYAVDIGQAVKVGDTVVVLEAMKMENSMPSPVSGIVKTLPAAVGSTVRKGDVLATIAPD